jgi:hypothetical protein
MCIQQAIKSSLVVFVLSCFSLTAFAQPAARVKLEEGTQVRLKLMETISSATAMAGQVVSFEVLDDVRVGEILVIAEGAPAWGTIVEAERKKSLGRGGKLAFRLDYVKAVDGTKAPLRTTSISQGRGKGLTTGIAAGASAVLFWPAAPFFLLMKGRNAEVPRGYHLAAFVDGDRLIAVREAAEAGTEAPVTSRNPSAVLISQTASPAVSKGGEFGSVYIISDPGGAEVEIDGAYYGNTPGLIRVPAGLHSVTIRYANHTPWKRTVNIAPGSNLTLKADLSPGKNQTIQRQ